MCRQKHANVAIFVPHAGCPHQCSFCNQRAISGASRQPEAQDVRDACETALRTMRVDAAQSEIAFFGGSFTAIDRRVMCSLLEAAAPYVKAGRFKGIRVSTRPDAVDGEVLSLLRHYGVSAVELGAQSMDDAVLAANGRGHTAADVERASTAIHEAGLELGLQMMTGLYASSDEQDEATARRLAALKPRTMRLYPTIVMEHTALAAYYREGCYTPPTLEQAVTLCTRLLTFFEEEQGIPVIRLGLHAGQEMQQGRLAGPWHPAFRELCEGERLYERTLTALRAQLPQGGVVTIQIAPAFVSRMIGHKRRNVQRFDQAGYTVTVQSDPTLAPGNFHILKNLQLSGMERLD